MEERATTHLAAGGQNPGATSGQLLASTTVNRSPPGLSLLNTHSHACI